MTTLTDNGLPTLAEIAGRLDPDGSAARIADVLEKKNPVLRDIPWMEGNLPTGHKITLTDTSYPTATWRQLNLGVTSTKGKTAQYVESCGVLEDHSRIDELAVKLNGGPAWRESEDMIKMKALPEQFATALFYESVSSNQERIHGLAPRYPATTGYDSSSYVLAGTNAGVNARSMWLCTWEERKLYGIYPKGTMAGLQRVDKGLVPIQDASNRMLFQWLTQFVWMCGIAVEDYRYAVRAQWDPDDPAMAASEKGLYLMAMDMSSVIHEVTPNTRLYMDRTTLRRLNAQLITNENRPMQYMAIEGGKLIGDGATLGGDRVPVFNGIPIRVTDALTAETAIS